MKRSQYYPFAPFFVIVGCFALLCTVLQPVPAAAQEDPVSRVSYPFCSETLVTECIVSFEVAEVASSFEVSSSVAGETFADKTNDFTFEAPPAEVTIRAERFTGWEELDSLTIYPEVNGNSDFHPFLPVGSVIRVVLNTGDFEPPSTNFGTGDFIEWSRTFDDATGWTMTWVARTIGGSSALNCSVEDCDDPGESFDYFSVATAAMFGDSGGFTLDEYNRELIKLRTGSWVSTNASAYSDVFLSGEERTLTVQLAAPHLTQTGDLNEGFLSAFVTDGTIEDYFQVDKASLLTKGVLAAVIEDGDETSTVAVLVEEVEGGLRLELSDFHFSSPKISVKMQRVRRPAKPERISVRGKTSKAVVKTDAIKRAETYLAVCKADGVKVKATNDRPRVVVRDLTAGTWVCRVRGLGIGTIKGKWSKKMTVTVD